jgi:hypothetical protein
MGIVMLVAKVLVAVVAVPAGNGRAGATDSDGFVIVIVVPSPVRLHQYTSWYSSLMKDDTQNQIDQYA